MKSNYKLTLGVLAGSLLGVAGATAIHARQMKTPLAYVIAEVEVTDPATFKQYADKAAGTIAAHDGRYIVRSGKTISLEGDAPKRFIVIQFESMEKAKAWEDSPDYEAIKPIRHSSAKSRVFIAEGVAPM